MKFYIETLGCKVNSYESNYIAESSVNNGFLLTYNVTDANIIIINTCTVTNTADNNIDIEEVNKMLAEVVPRQQQIRKELEEIIKELEVDYHE